MESNFLVPNLCFNSSQVLLCAVLMQFFSDKYSYDITWEETEAKIRSSITECNQCDKQGQPGD